MLDLTKIIKEESTNLQRLKDEVSLQQQETQKQGLAVKKMTNFLSEKLDSIEMHQSNSSNFDIDKFSETESKLRLLRGRLNDYIGKEDAENLKRSNSSLYSDLKNYEMFLLQLTSSINEKIPQLEKIANRIRAESREAQQQKLLLKEVSTLKTQRDFFLLLFYLSIGIMGQK